MNILVITNLFPNSKETTRGIFVFQETRALRNYHDISVIAPLPWTPGIHIHKKYDAFNDVPVFERIDDFEVFHPRYFVSPKIGRRFYGYNFKMGIRGIFNKLIEENIFDVVISHYAYPDGYGTQMLAESAGLPHIIKVRGSDINVHINNNKGRKKLTLRALQRSDSVITVSDDLRNKIIALGINPEHVVTVKNGIDTGKFTRLDKARCRENLNWDQKLPVILFVGLLRPVKGIMILLEAFRIIHQENPAVRLVLVGDGELRKEAERFVFDKGLTSNVHFAGMRPHDEIPIYLSACDVLCLPSLNEGCPNIILEAMAIGCNIAASSVGGIPELLNSYEAGLLVKPEDSQNLADTLMTLIKVKKEVSFSLNRSWKNVAEETTTIISQVITERRKKKNI